MDLADSPTPLWTHKNPHSTAIWKFKSLIEEKYKVRLDDYDALHRWSIHNLDHFWTEFWHFSGVVSSKPFTKAIEDESSMFPRPAFFPGARLNFAENLLFPTCDPDPSSPAVIAASEDPDPDSSAETISWAELRSRVRRCARALRSRGLLSRRPGERVAGFVAHTAQALVAMLSATSLGGIWTAVSPDTGVKAALDRLVQIEPAVLFVDNAVLYNGRIHDTRQKVAELVRALPSLRAVVVLETVKDRTFELDGVDTPVLTYDRFVVDEEQTGAENLIDSHLPEFEETERDGIPFLQLPSDQPIYVLFSSGTTGKPKCIVHGAVGTLINHKKEHSLQSDIRPGDRLFYYTTTAWMMWHWQVSGLASGATLLLYSGSPFHPRTGPDDDGSLAMHRLIARYGITHFGTSAKYLSILEQRNVNHRDAAAGLPLPSLRTIFSTGSPLAPSTFDYVCRAFPGVALASISGGTDVISAFVGATPLKPVFRGEVQAIGLGFAIEVWDPTSSHGIGRSSSSGDVSTGTTSTTADDDVPGELVITRPFPCQPVFFWPPGPDGEKRYRASYFDKFPAEISGDGDGRHRSLVWQHGDLVRINPHTGGIFMLGRSDGVLNPSGVRFGSAEIYNLLLAEFPDDFEDALCVGRKRPGDPDETVVLFLKTAKAAMATDPASPDRPSPLLLSPDLVGRVRDAIRLGLSPRHVPGIIDACPEIPVTTNGKKVEIAVKQILSGHDARVSASVANRECLDWYREWSRTH